MSPSPLTVLMSIGAAAALTAVISILVAAAHPFRRRRGPIGPAAAVLTYAALALQLVIFISALAIYKTMDIPTLAVPDGTLSLSNTETTVPPATEAPRPPFTPAADSTADPALWEMTWEIEVNGETVTSFQREEPIRFDSSDYFALPGICTFRGNNYRSSAAYGTAEVTQGALETVWSHPVGYLESTSWIGCAWTGQPLVVQWDEETKQIMNLYEDKKAKEGLVEVIYAKLDGCIHFYDLEDGTVTRDPIAMKMVFKGSGALDPRGYPILYVGGGVKSRGTQPKMFAVSLIDGKILWEYSGVDSFALRNWYSFDSSPLVDANTDTLIWPGENGILYTVKLNTSYDKDAGTLTIEPGDMQKTRYTSTYSKNQKRYLGYEASASIVENFLYVSENGGLFHCIDLNTMELVWAQDTLDDSNSSPLFDWGDDGNGYIYTAPSLHWTQKSHKGDISIYKLNAQTGEVVWTYTLPCTTYDGISGGVQSSPLLGKAGTDIGGLVLYSVGRTPGPWEGKLVALDKESGALVWEADTGNYTWSSPVPIYTEDGRAYIFLANASGVCRLYDGATGRELHSIDLDQTVEASPVVFGNMLVLGSREGVYGIRVF